MSKHTMMCTSTDYIILDSSLDMSIFEVLELVPLKVPVQSDNS